MKIHEHPARTHLMKSMGLLHLGVGGGSVFEGDGKKQREALTRETRYGVGSILVEEGAPPSTVFIILEGECRIVKGKHKPQQSGEKRPDQNALRCLPATQMIHLSLCRVESWPTAKSVRRAYAHSESLLSRRSADR